MLPTAELTEVAAEAAIQPSAPADVPVYLGCSSKGPLGVPTPFGARATRLTEATFGAGPLTREGAYPSAKVAAPFLYIRLPKVARVAVKSAPLVTKDPSSTFTSTLSGNPTDGYDFVIDFVVGGTTGITGITYQVSEDGGSSFGAVQSLSTATSITVGGVSIALGSAHVVTAGDQIAFWTIPASETILPTTVTRVASSTSTMTPSGAPNDTYDSVIVQFLTGGTIGVVGITYWYSLDGGSNWSTVKALQTTTTILPLDGVDPSGITLTLGAGTIDAGDQIQFSTTGPAYQWSDASAALDTLRASNLTWSFLVFTGYGTEAFAASAASKVQGWAASTRFSWLVTSARDRGTWESDLAWSGRLGTNAGAEWASFADNRTAVAAGSSRVTCPLTGRSDRRPVSVATMPRVLGLPVDVDMGQKSLGPLSSDVAIHGAGGLVVEHDARLNTSLYDAGFLVLRTWEGEKGIQPGVFPARGNIMGPSGDIQRIVHRRVLNIADAAKQKAMEAQLLLGFLPWASNVRAPFKAGDIREPDALRIEQALSVAVRIAVIDPGYCVAPAKGPIVVLNRTPQIINGDTTLLSDTKLTGKRYVDQFKGTIGFTDPALDALFSQPS